MQLQARIPRRAGEILRHPTTAPSSTRRTGRFPDSLSTSTATSPLCLVWTQKVPKVYGVHSADNEFLREMRANDADPNRHR